MRWDSLSILRYVVIDIMIYKEEHWLFYFKVATIKSRRYIRIYQVELCTCVYRWCKWFLRSQRCECQTSSDMTNNSTHSSSAAYDRRLGLESSSSDNRYRFRVSTSRDDDSADELKCSNDSRSILVNLFFLRVQWASFCTHGSNSRVSKMLLSKSKIRMRRSL